MAFAMEVDVAKMSFQRVGLLLTLLSFMIVLAIVDFDVNIVLSGRGIWIRFAGSDSYVFSRGGSFLHKATACDNFTTP